MNASEKSVLWGLLAATVLFVPLFIWQRIGAFDFWWWMAAVAGLASVTGLIIDRGYARRLADDFRHRPAIKLAGGFLFAFLLYVIFAAGNELARAWMPSGAREITAVYDFRQGASMGRVAALLICVIGPGEEIFWRGFLQRAMMERWGRWRGCVAATVCYGAMHGVTGNFMLVAAALVCGAAWGWLYARHRSVLLNAVSHTVWDVAVFLLWPFV